MPRASAGLFFKILSDRRSEPGSNSGFKTPASDFRFFGGYKAVARPVPIPNTAVKRSLADGSGPIGSARVGCRQIFL